MEWTVKKYMGLQLWSVWSETAGEEVCYCQTKKQANQIAAEHNALAEVTAISGSHARFSCGYPLKPCCCGDKAAYAIKKICDELAKAEG